MSLSASTATQGDWLAVIERSGGGAVAPAPANARSTVGGAIGSGQHLQLLDAISSPGVRAASMRASALAVRSRVDASTWRANASLQLTHRLCVRCDVVTARADGDSCTACGEAFGTMTAYGSPAELSAFDNLSERTAYGRSLVCLQGRAQVETAGAAIAPGSEGYALSVFARNESLFTRHQQRTRIEAMVHAGVSKLDAFVALHTNGAARVYTREDVRAFAERDDVEALVTEYVQSHGSIISIGGGASKVQVSCHRIEGTCGALDSFATRRLRCDSPCVTGKGSCGGGGSTHMGACCLRRELRRGHIRWPASAGDMPHTSGEGSCGGLMFDTSRSVHEGSCGAYACISRRQLRGAESTCDMS